MAFCGYNEIQEPRKKNILINYERLRQLLGYDTYDRLKANHKEWVESLLSNGKNGRDGKWTSSIAVGNADFVQNMKLLMGPWLRDEKVLNIRDRINCESLKFLIMIIPGLKKAK